MNPVKRCFDIVLSLLLGLLLAPVMLLIAISIKATSPGPVLFRQTRLGRASKTFKINKFRKFPSDFGDDGPGVTLQYDSRMTRLGQVLERTKLDELPQLWNILIGEMSFVGPRPELLRFRHLFKGEFTDVLNYTPGIFGPNQTKYRNESSMFPRGIDPDVYYEKELFPRKARADIEYFKGSTFISDLACILSGLFVILFFLMVWRNSTKSTFILLLWDILAVISAWVITHWLKYNVVFDLGIIVGPSVATLFKSGIIVTPLALVLVFGIARVYRHPVRYFSETDFFRLVGAACSVWIISAVAFGIMLDSTSSLLLAVSCVVSIFFMALPRIIYKLWLSTASSSLRRENYSDTVNVLVFGISTQSIELCNLLKTGFDNSNVIGILADDNTQVRREIHGFEVLGELSDLDVLHIRYNIEQIWIGTTMEPAIQNIIDEWCASNKVEMVVLNDLPGFRSLLIENQSESVVPKIARTSLSGA